MCLPPADYMEELDPPAEIEKECRERVIDIERKDKEKADKKKREAEEKLK